MEYKKLEDIIEFNPTETLKKGTVSKKIPMDKLGVFSKYINSFDIEKYNGGMKFRNGDTLLARITPCLENGKTSKVTILDEEEVGFGSTEYIVMRSKKNISDEDFIFYLAISPKFREIAIKSMTGTSGRQRVQLDVVKNTEMLIPSYEEQIKIGKVLSSIDKRIELNNQINDNLYEITNKLYEQLFFIERQAEWKEYNLQELMDISNGYSYTGKELVNTSAIGMATIKNFERKGGFKEEGFKDIEPIKAKSIHYADKFYILVACTDLTQNADIIGNAVMLLNTGKYEKVVISMDLVKILPKKNKYLVFSILNSKEFKNFALGYKTGTTVLHLNKNCFKDFNIKLPDLDKIEKFEKIVEINYKKISSNLEENNTLTQLRDTLLPKLMNGEIDLDKIEI